MKEGEGGQEGVINCRLFIKSPFYIIWELRLVVPSFQHFYLIYFYSAWIYNAHFYLFLFSAWIRILFHLLHLHLPLFVNIWEHDISECSLWNIPAQSSNPWPLAWLTFSWTLNAHSCRGPLVGHIIRYYTLLLYLLSFWKLEPTSD